MYRSYLPISRAIFSEILTPICQIKSKQGGQLVAESLIDFIFSQMSKPKEMSRKFRNRLVAKFPVIKHNKQETQIKTVGH